MSKFLVITKDTYAKEDVAICEWNWYVFGVNVATVRHTTTEWQIINKIITRNKSVRVKGFNNEN